MVFTFGNPMNIRLTDEGSALAHRLHRAAEARGDCRCGLVLPAVDGESADEGHGTAARAGGASGGAGAASGAARRSPVRQEPPRAPPARAPPPRVDDDDECIVISDDDVAAPAPPPAKRHATQPVQRPQPLPREAAGASGGVTVKPLPQWRLSALNSGADHGTCVSALHTRPSANCTLLQVCGCRRCRRAHLSDRSTMWCC